VTERFHGPETEVIEFEFRPDFMAEGIVDRGGFPRLDPARFAVGRDYLLVLRSAPRRESWLAPGSLIQVSQNEDSWLKWCRQYRVALAAPWLPW